MQRSSCLTESVTQSCARAAREGPLLDEAVRAFNRAFQGRTNELQTQMQEAKRTFRRTDDQVWCIVARDVSSDPPQCRDVCQVWRMPKTCRHWQLLCTTMQVPTWQMNTSCPQ